MFNAIATTENLQQFVDTASAIVDEAKIHLEENCLRLKAVDPANVAMIQQSLGAAAFESYEADGGTIGVNLGKLDDVIGMANSDDLVHLELNEETRKLHIQIDGLSYTLALIDPDSIRSEPDIPDLDLNGEAVVEANVLDQAVTAADLCSDHIALGFDVDGEYFFADAEGDTDDVHYEVAGDDLLEGSQFQSDARSLFSLDYLQDIGKPIPSDAEVTLKLGSEFPTKLRYQYADGKGTVTNMLAPRIQSD